MSRQYEFFGSLANLASVAVPIDMQPSDEGFQVSITGGGTATITTEEENLAGAVPQTDTASALIFDLRGIKTVNLTAAGALNYRITIRR